MHDRQIAILEALDKAKAFLTENWALLPKEVDLTNMRTWHHEATEVLTAYATDQDVGDRAARMATARLHDLRMRLRREHMEPIAIIARLMLRGAPEFGALQMPACGLRGELLLARARTMLDAARTYRDTFRKYGLPATFIDDFQAAIDMIDESMTDRELNRARRAKATHGLKAAAREGRVVLQVLDVLVMQATREDESLWSAWQEARLIRGSSVMERAPRRA